MHEEADPWQPVLNDVVPKRDIVGPTAGKVAVHLGHQVAGQLLPWKFHFAGLVKGGN